MKHFILALLAAVSLAALAQDRTEVFFPEDVSVTAMSLQPLADGGCAARWCGELPSDDAGIVLRACTDVTELRNSLNQARCAGLEVAGAPRVLQGMRFAVDGGTP